MEYLNFPPQRIPLELLNSVLPGLNGKISDQLPLDFLPVFRSPTLIGMNHRQGQCGISLLLPDRRQNFESCDT